MKGQVGRPRRMPACAAALRSRLLLLNPDEVRCGFLQAARSP